MRLTRLIPDVKSTKLPWGNFDQQAGSNETTRPKGDGSRVSSRTVGETDLSSEEASGQAAPAPDPAPAASSTATVTPGPMVEVRLTCFM